MIVAQELYREFRTVKRQPGFLGSIRTLFTRQYNVVRAVDHVSFSIERGEVAKEHMRRFIAEINHERGVTVILASNDMADVERLCERIIIIDRGRLLYDGTVEEIKRHHAPYRTLVVHFGEDYPDIRAEGAELVRRDTRRAWLRFDRTVNPQRLIADLSQRYLITDLSLAEPTLEEVIRGIYEQTGREEGEP